MSTKFQRVRGTKDLLPEESKLFRYIVDIAQHISELYGYGEIQTPIFESSEVFHRTLGETSDAVNKETYTFLDRGGESITLRPEGTAGIARAFLSEGLQQNLPLRLFYHGPMFRYERPQKGRQRQFHQLGVECLGLESPLCDAETIALGWRILGSLDLQTHCHIEINTLGDFSSRAAYRDSLVGYFSQFKSQLSADSLIRLEKNPLRILDSKEEGDRKLIDNAPVFSDFLNAESKVFFSSVKETLEKLKIPFSVNERLVRGLDYYCHTVFEIVTDQLGAQGTLLAGGRYDGLISSMGGPSTPGVGWAAGIERLAELTKPHLVASKKSMIAIIPADGQGESISLQVAENLRNQGICSEIIWGGNVGKKMKKADKIGATGAIILGASEVELNKLTCKNLKTGEQFSLDAHDFSQLKAIFALP